MLTPRTAVSLVNHATHTHVAKATAYATTTDRKLRPARTKRQSPLSLWLKSAMLTPRTAVSLVNHATHTHVAKATAYATTTDRKLRPARTTHEFQKLSSVPVEKQFVWHKDENDCR